MQGTYEDVEISSTESEAETVEKFPKRKQKRMSRHPSPANPMGKNTQTVCQEQIPKMENAVPNPSCNISPAVCQNESREIQNESLSKQTYQRTRRYNTQRREQDMKDLQKMEPWYSRREFTSKLCRDGPRLFWKMRIKVY